MSRFASFPLVFAALVAVSLLWVPVGGATPLDDYVAAPDASYSYGPAPITTYSGAGWTAVMWPMTSQSWLTPELVDRTLWEHQLTIIVPDTVSHSKAMLFIAGGYNNGYIPSSPPGELTFIAVESQSIVAELRQIPNQRIKFADETDPRYIDIGRREDELIAYCWDKYRITGDATWLPRLPMTKAVVRAMDTVQAEYPSVDGFVVSGASKRGWTTWTTGLVDTRVVAIMPLVIDVLNVEHSMQHHWDAYGYWADAIGNYTDMNIMSWLHTPEFRNMMAVVDPYRYADERLTMPKYVVSATGDEFFLPDSSWFYYDALKGEKYLRYVPNTDHGLSTEAVYNLEAYYEAILNNVPRPEFTWSKLPSGALRVETSTPPSDVRLWQATNPTARNFRLDSIGAAYTSSVLSDQGGGVYVGSVPAPAQGWTAYFVELTFPSGGSYPFKFTTGVAVTPDTLPFRSVGGWGTIETAGEGDDQITLVKLGGSRYEMGYWYGKLLADQIAPCWAGLKAAMGAPEHLYDEAIDAMWRSKYFDIDAWEQELRGVADGCNDAGHPEITFRELQKMHLVPDMSEYYCGLFSIWGNATADGHQYQMRNLDWSMDTGAQNYPVVAVFDPTDGQRHAVIGFAGLIGAAVGGMNEHGIAVSQIMGGFGDPETLDGAPFPVLLRDTLYHESTLAGALERVGSATRTNQYYYCLSGPDEAGDADARLIFSSNSRFDTFGGGESALPHPYYSPFHSPLQDVVYWKRHDGGAYAMPGPEDNRKGNQTLFAAINERYGTIDAKKAIEIAVADGVSGTVVSIVYDNTARRFWVAFAEGTSPAQAQRYVGFDLDGPLPEIELTSPAGGEAWEVGTDHVITWESMNVPGLVKLYYSVDGGATWVGINYGAPNTGSYTWHVDAPVSANVKIRVRSKDDLRASDDSGVFSVVPSSVTPPGNPIVLTPNPVVVGNALEIAWPQAAVSAASVKIYYSLDDGASWTAISYGAPNTGSYQWTVDAPVAAQTDSARIRVRSKAGYTDFSADSDALTILPETIGPPANPITLNPVPVAKGGVLNIGWPTSGISGLVKIYYSLNDGASWAPISYGAANTGAYAWTVNAGPSATARIRVRSKNNMNEFSADSEGFVITSP